MVIIELFYAACILLLSLYGFNSLILTWLYLRHRHDPSSDPAPPPEWPHVTVQLPIYNELHTVERLLGGIVALDYPRDRLEIQVLDDSTDATRQITAHAVADLRGQGINVVHITRSDRVGYKAGALAAGLTTARGELVAIFDADFVPPSDFLKRVVPHFGDPTVGCIQTRWGHLNRDYSPFTQTQALGVDGHFVVEQTARSRAGLFINFNGTAGVWRRACIEDAGGWQGDTLTEDLDLSYRAQLRGWRFVYLPDVIVPAELPAQISAFKQQQARWAQGSIQTALKLLAPLFRSDQPWRVKLEGALHLTGYLVHPLMLLVVLLTLPMSFSHSWVLAIAPWLMMAAAGPPSMYIVAQITADSPSHPHPVRQHPSRQHPLRQHPELVEGELVEGELVEGQPINVGAGWRRRLRVLPLLVLLGVGLALSNTRAVLKAVLRVPEGFQRTPKFALRQPGDPWVGSIYALRRDGLVWGELGLSFFAMALLAAPGVNWGFAPWLLLYAGGFGYVAAVNLRQAHQRRRWLTAQTRVTEGKAARIPRDARGRIRAD